MKQNNLGETGILTNMNVKIWGPPMWVSLHTISFSYPINPTNIDKQNFKQYFTLVGDMLPCILCKNSYKEFIKSGETKLDDEVMLNKDNLTKWLYHLHNKVNFKLGVNYDVSYDDICKKYNSYIVSCSSNSSSPDAIYKQSSITNGCDNSLTPKYLSFKNSNYSYTDCIIIPYKIVKHYINYAKLRNLSDDDMYVVNNYKKCRENKDEWIKRNKECHEIITFMRENNIASLEESEEWNGLPTIHELKLLMRLSSTLNKNKLIELLKILPKCDCEYKKIYRLVKKA